MAISPADFYAYSRATGTQLPDDPEERAKLAPEVVAFRRGQLRNAAPKENEGFDFGSALAVGATLVGAGLATLAARRGLRAKPSVAAPKVETILPETVARAQTAAQTQDFGAVGSLVRDLPTPQEPAVLRQPLTGQTSPLPRRQPGSFAELTGIEQEIIAEVKAGELLNEILEEQREIDKENKFQTRVVQGIEGKEKAGAKNFLAQSRREKEAEGFSPRSYVESTGAVAPSEDLTTIQINNTPVVANQQINAVESGEDQFTGRQLREMQRDTDTTRTGKTSPVSLPIVFEREASPLTDAAGSVLPVGDSMVAKLNRNKTRRQLALNQARATLGLAETDAPLPEGFSMVPEGEVSAAAGELAAQKLREAKQRKQKQSPSPITQEWKEILFDESGLLNKEILAKNLGDEKVFPGQLANMLIEGMSSSSTVRALSTGNFNDIEIDPDIHRVATQHVKENLLKFDDADSIKRYLISGGIAGEYQPPSTKGFGYTGTESMPTQLVSISKKGGEELVLVSGPRTSSRRTRSDLEPLFFDPDTKTLIRKSDIGATQSSEAVAGTGIGAEIGQAVAFVPREDVAGFVNLPGVNASGPENVNKSQGVGYAIGGLKELGSIGSGQISSKDWKAIRQRRKELGLKPTETNAEIEGMLERARGRDDVDLSVQPRPLFRDPYDALEKGNVKLSRNNTPYLVVDALMLKANPGLETYLSADPNYSNFLFANPATGQNFTSVYEATNTYNRLANNVNAKLITGAESRIAALEKGENLEVQVTVRGNKLVKTALNPNFVVDQVVRRNSRGETIVSNVTLSQAIRNQLLFPIVRDSKGMPMRGQPLLQEHTLIDEQGQEGAKYFKQTRYLVPENKTYVDKETGEIRAQILGFGDTELAVAPTTLNPSDTRLTAKNNYLFLQGVNNALEEITGQRIKVIDDAIYLGREKGFEFMGGPSKNPVLREALTVANTLTQTSEKSRIRMQEPEKDFGLGERYGLGARQSERPRRNVPSGIQLTNLPVQKVVFTEMQDPSSVEMRSVTQLKDTGRTMTLALTPEVIGGKRLAAFVLDYTQTSGKPMRIAAFNQAVLDLSNQLGADPAELSRQAATFLRGSREQARVGPVMSQGRRALQAMDRPSPAEEIAQTIAEYDFNETIGSDIESVLQGPQVPLDVDMELTARQAQRARVEPPGTTEKFTIDDQMLSNQMNRLMAQAGRRAAKRRRR
jgi:hypothetical protein